MAKWNVQHVTIIGVGLLGGSIGLAVRRTFPRAVVAGVGRRKTSLDLAKKHKCIHEAYLDAAEPASRSDLVILATPVCAFEKHLRTIGSVLKRGALVTDVGSTKAEVVRIGEKICRRGGAFVGSHPMAGNENKGPAFATADLLKDALCIVTPTKHTPAAKLRRIESFWRELGMRTHRMNPTEHDRAVAAVSHVPHAVAALLMLLPKDAELPVAATGLRDMTRLAGGDPEMWRDIMTTNRKAILGSLEKFSRSMSCLRTLLDSDDAKAIERFFARAKTRRDATLQ